MPSKHSGEVCLHSERTCGHCKKKFHTTTKENCYLDLCLYCFHGIERPPQKKPEKTEDSPGKTISCQHAEDVCQYCLEKVQTTTEKEDSPPGALSHLNKKVLIFINSSTIVASGVLWYFSTKKLFNIANKAVNSIFETIVAPIYKG